MAYPPPRLACNGLSRHILGRKLPAVFHGPIARGLALDSPGLPRPTDADEQTTTDSALQVEGSCCARFADG